jgi:DnaK suppressor protein
MTLTSKEQQALRAQIERRRAQLLEELHDDVARTRGDRFEELAGAAPDRGDESVAALIADLDHAEVARDLSELRGLEAARNRMAEGSYGQCADCGVDIAFERLRANPAAARCIRCQGAREKIYGTATGSSL